MRQRLDQKRVEAGAPESYIPMRFMGAAMCPAVAADCREAALSLAPAGSLAMPGVMVMPVMVVMVRCRESGIGAKKHENGKDTG